MKQRGHMVTGDSLGANPVVNSEDLVSKKGQGGFLTEDEVLKRADEVLQRDSGKTNGDS